MHTRSNVLGVVLAIAGVALAGSFASAARTPVVPSSAEVLSTVPTTVSGVASGRLRKNEPVPQCASVAGVRWYTVKAPHRGAMVARLVARDDLDGALAVYRIVRSQRIPVICAETNRHGRARLAWYAYTEGSYLIGVARRQGSAVGPYDLTVLSAERPEKPPGTPLPAAGIRATVNAVLDATDAWSVEMAPGITYRLNLTTTSKYGCTSYSIYRPGVSSFVHGRPVSVKECGGYSEFTPGAAGGGLYSVVVSTERGDPIDHAYRLEVAQAAADDTAPGISLTNGEFVSGDLFGRGIDVLDMYRFAVPRPKELTTIELRQKPNVGFDLLVLGETGARVGTIHEGRGLQVLRLRIPAGHYFAVVRSRAGNGGTYGLQVRVRDLTTTTISSNGASFTEAPPETSLPLTVHVDSASHGGRVIVEIDHFDPIAGWHFATTLTGTLDAAGNFTTSWLPPSVGHFRARAWFVANPYSSFSSSGYVRLHVAEPLE